MDVQALSPRSQRRNPRQPFAAYGAARALWSARDEEILIEGPAGTGKTRAILEKIHFMMLKYPGARALLVRKTRESMTESVLEIFEDKVLPEGSPITNGPKRKFRTVYNYPNGSAIVIGGMDKPVKIMSTEFDVIGCFETTELTEEDFENLTTRLRNGVIPYQQIIADCNPDVPQHWLNRRPSKVPMLRLKSRHWDNPTLFDHKARTWTDSGRRYLQKLMRLSGARRLRLFKGIWAAQEGLVFEEFNSSVHVIKRFRIPGNWKRIRVIDFGYRDPFVCQWWAINPIDGAMYLYREIYMTERLVQDHAAYINELSEGEKYEATICDWDLEDRKTLERYGIFTIPAYKDIARGIQAVQERLRLAKPYNRPRLFVMERSLVEPDQKLVENSQPHKTEDEFGSYIWPKGKDGKPLKEEPVDLYNHGMDTMRYAVAYVNNLASQRFKVLGGSAVVVKKPNNTGANKVVRSVRVAA